MVTLHCLTGCLLGEWLGLALGVGLSLPARATVVLATALAYASGFGLTSASARKPETMAMMPASRMAAANLLSSKLDMALLADS